MNRWHAHFLRIARECAKMSKDPSSGIGAVVVKDRQIISTGFNGFPPQIPDDPTMLSDRDSKYRHVVHAEVNALLRAGPAAKGAILYLYGFKGAPCGECAKFLLACGITRYIATGVDAPERWKENLAASDGMLREAGVEIEYFDLGDVLYAFKPPQEVQE